MSELSKRIEELHLEKQDRLVQQLEENEKKRQTKLIVKGHLDRPYDFVKPELENTYELGKQGRSFSTKGSTKSLNPSKTVDTPFRLPKL